MANGGEVRDSEWKVFAVCAVVMATSWVLRLPHLRWWDALPIVLTAVLLVLAARAYRRAGS